jgi:radical SAM protein with 4Fe4S-binding SPASM domain
MAFDWLRRRLFGRDPLNFANRLIDREESILPYRIVLETLSYCNGVCSFCPANKIVDTRGKNAMPMEMIDKILSELAAWRYAGVIALHGNSEPLLNENICQIVEKVRKALPDCIISIWTNGTKLDWSKHEALFINGLNHMHINNYSPKNTMHRSVREFLDAFKASPFASRPDIVVDLEMRKVDEVLLNKGGIAPKSEMQINYNGDLFSCCFDDYYRTVLGNVKSRSIQEIWNSPEYRRFRKEVVNGNRANYPACKTCDVPHNLPESIRAKSTASGHDYIVNPGIFGKSELDERYSRGAKSH